jgi:hypothetical protein
MSFAAKVPLFHILGSFSQDRLGGAIRTNGRSKHGRTDQRLLDGSIGCCTDTTNPGMIAIPLGSCKIESLQNETKGNSMTNTIALSISHAGVIDTRDLQDLLEEVQAYLDDHQSGEYPLDPEALEAYTSLRDTLTKAEWNVGPEWAHGAMLVAEGYFTEYARELLEDCGTIPRDLPAFVVIDWEATAENLRSDYAEVEIEGHTYLFRD